MSVKLCGSNSLLVEIEQIGGESVRILTEVYEEHRISNARVSEWHKRFCKGGKDVQVE